jgi:hypothetical protein
MSYCPPPPVPAVTFDYSAWVARYPEFSAVSSVSAGLYFNEATAYCQNAIGPVPTVALLMTFLNMLTAHIAALNSPVTASGANPSTPPGRISNASEGSVSVAFQNDYPPGSAQWYQQTKYGSAYWQASLPYRLGRYVPPCYGPASLAQVPWQYPNTGS